MEISKSLRRKKLTTRLFTGALTVFVLLCVWLLPTTDIKAAILDIEASWSHTVALKVDGTIWSWGDNRVGQLGIGNTTNQLTPVQVVGLIDVSAIAAGGNCYTVALKDDGTVWAWGGNALGELGIGNTTSQYSPVHVAGLTDVIAISTGHTHTVALKDDGTVWAWGRNTFGELGIGNTTNQLTPVQVVGLNDVSAISAGSYHTVALKDDGTVWAWGGNGYGELGIDNTTNQLTPVQVVGLNDVSAISAGSYHTVVLRDDGTVWGWGWNKFGELGIGNTTDQYSPVHVAGLTDVVSITAGGGHTVALKNDGTVWVWGSNSFGQLGIGNTIDQSTPVQVVGLTDVIAIAAGMYLTAALKDDGSVWVWGSNSLGQLGTGNTTDQLAPVQIPNFSLVIAREITPISPVDGTVVGGWPDLVWKGKEGAYQYQIILDSQIGLDRTYIVFASHVCDPDTLICTIEDAGLQPLVYGDFRWQQIDWKYETDPDWTSTEFEDTFKVVAAFPLTPEGIITTPMPDYSWQMHGDHTTRFWFQMVGQIIGDHKVLETWVDVADNCSSDGLCEFSSDTSLLNGDYTYSLIQWSQEMGGLGALSNRGEFTIVQEDSLIQPKGTVEPSEQLTFRWREVFEMNSYDITLTNSDGDTVFAKSVSAMEDNQPICVDGQCEWTVGINLETGSYTWSLRPEYIDEDGTVGWLDGKTGEQIAALTQALEASFYWSDEPTPPSLSFTDPIEGEYFESNETFKVTVTVNNPSDITIEKIDFAVNGEKIEEMEEAPYLTYCRAHALGACTLTATAIDPNGVVLSETSITVNITEQSANKHVLFPVDDTYIRGGVYADQNYGGKGEIVLKEGSGDYLRYGFSKFDLSSIVGQIESAELHYFCRQHYDTAFKFYFVANDDWDEDALTFNTQPAFGQFLDEASLSSEQVTLDITQTVRQELSGDAMLSLGIKGTADYFSSLKTKDSKYINLHPYLIVRTDDND